MLAFGMLVFTGFLMAQEVSLSPEKKWPEQDKKSKSYTISGERHGQSFFKKYEFPEVQYIPGEKLTFDIFANTLPSSANTFRNRNHHFIF